MATNLYTQKESEELSLQIDKLSEQLEKCQCQLSDLRQAVKRQIGKSILVEEDYAIGDIRLLSSEQALLWGGYKHPLRTQLYRVLRGFVEAPLHRLTKEDIYSLLRTGDGVYVSEASIYRIISDLRKVFIHFPQLKLLRSAHEGYQLLVCKKD